MRRGFISDVSFAVTKQFRSFHRLLTVSQVGPKVMFSKSFAVLSTIWLLSRGCGARVWSWALGPDESAHFHLQEQVCVVSFIQIFCCLYSQSSQVDPFDHKVGTALPNSLHEHAQGGAKSNLA